MSAAGAATGPAPATGIATTGPVREPELPVLPASGGRPSRAGAVIILLRRLVRVGLRQPVFGFVFPIVFPVVLLGFVSSMFQHLADLPGFPLRSYTAYVAPGVVMMIPMIGAGYGAGALIEDIQSGFVDRLRLQGVGVQAVIAAKMLFEMVRILPAGLIVMGLLVTMGAPLRAGLASAGLCLVVMCGWSAAYSTLFYIVGVRSLNPQAPLALLPLVLPVLFMSPALMPRPLLPPWLQAAVLANPFTHVLDATVVIMRGPDDPSALLRGGAAVLVTFALLQLRLRGVVRSRMGV